MRRAAAILVFALAFAARSLAGVQYPLPPIPENMTRVEGQNYLLIHDLTDAEAGEVMARMDAMAREYQKRTRDFAGRVQGRMPFLIFRRDEDYEQAGGRGGTAGVFNGQVLMAVAGKKLTAGTWHTIQHEGFHQFAGSVIGGDLPPWVNEGLAEYFGEGVYTGDGFVTGGIPAYRLKRIQETIQQKQFKSAQEMLRMTYETWNGDINETNYDQAWAMVQFFAHADGGKYQRPFAHFMAALAQRQPWAKAWDDAFGPVGNFETQWAAWWTARPTDATPEVYAEAAARMLANYAARAASQKQAFLTVDDLITAITNGTVRTAPGDALPAGLATDCGDMVAALKRIGVSFAMEFPLKGNMAWPTAIAVTLPDGRLIRATTPTRGPRAGAVQVTTVPLKAVKVSENKSR